MKKTIYLASPYGFTSSGVLFMESRLVPQLEKDFKLLNPWEALTSNEKRIKKIFAISDPAKKVATLGKFNDSIARENMRLIDKSDALLAVLDGTDVDSGVASEIGYAYAKSKLIVGYRSDFRLTGDNMGTTVNLQVEYFINRSGGIIARDLNGLFKFLRAKKKAN